MILVDTSVWIAYLQGGGGEGVAAFEDALDRGIPFAVTGVIVQEILQGVRTESDRTRLEHYLKTQRSAQPRHPWETYVAAARLFARCRRAGITIRSTNDCLIAQIAIENDLALLHEDRDFEHMASVVEELRTYRAFSSRSG